MVDVSRHVHLCPYKVSYWRCCRLVTGLRMSSVQASSVFDPVLGCVTPQSIPNSGQFYALYMGSTYVTDAQEKNALKMAARLLLEQDQQIVLSACEVDLHVLNGEIKAVRRVAPDAAPCESIILQVPYHQVSACFILREDNKIVSIGVTDSKSISHAHVFMLTTIELAEKMVSMVLKKFSRFLEEDYVPLEVEVKQTISEPLKPEAVMLKAPPLCLFDCYNL